MAGICDPAAVARRNGSSAYAVCNRTQWCNNRHRALVVNWKGRLVKDLGVTEGRGIWGNGELDNKLVVNLRYDD